MLSDLGQAVVVAGASHLLENWGHSLLADGTFAVWEFVKGFTFGVSDYVKDCASGGAFPNSSICSVVSVQGSHDILIDVSRMVKVEGDSTSGACFENKNLMGALSFLAGRIFGYEFMGSLGWIFLEILVLGTDPNNPVAQSILVNGKLAWVFVKTSRRFIRIVQLMDDFGGLSHVDELKSWDIYRRPAPSGNSYRVIFSPDDFF